MALVSSILTVLAWVVTGVFIFLNLCVNRSDRVNASLKEKASKSEIKNLKRKLEPRRISKEVWDNLAKTAKLHAGLSAVVNGVTSDPEREQLARDAAGFLQFAGVQTELHLPMIGGDLLATSGVVIFTSRSSIIEFTAFRDALITLGIQCEIKKVDFGDKPDFAFTVGAKPIAQ